MLGGFKIDTGFNTLWLFWMTLRHARSGFNTWMDLFNTYLNTQDDSRVGAGSEVLRRGRREPLDLASLPRGFVFYHDMRSFLLL